MARQCKNPRQVGRKGSIADAGSGSKPPDRSNPSVGSVNTVGCKNGTATECISMRSEISNGNELLLLVDTGADISLLKPDNLDKTKQYDPKGRVKVKGVSGSTIQTFGTVQTVIIRDR